MKRFYNVKITAIVSVQIEGSSEQDIHHKKEMILNNEDEELNPAFFDEILTKPRDYLYIEKMEAADF